MNQRLDDYARLVIEVGIQVQKGEPVMINCPVEALDFARLLTRHAYENGAREVVIKWYDASINRMTIDYAPLEVFEEFPQYLYDRDEYYYKQGVNLISVASPNPDLFKGADLNKLATQSRVANLKMKPLDHYTMNDEVSWCVAAYPNVEWAKKVFPGLPEAEAYDKLMDAILEMSRMNESHPVEAWQAHIDRLSRRADKLNAYRFASVHYQAANGTDLTVRLPEGHIWMAASSKNAKGTEFVPNIPTEEIFSLPDRNGVDGHLVSSKPLLYRGQLIDGFSFDFKNGAVVNFQAQEGEESLHKLLEEDEGAKHLGEIALVPYDSPISQSGILFYNTLFDENASCHFALGACYPTCLEGGAEQSDEEVLARGGNNSAVHVDFMVGTRDLAITGTTADGQEIPIFRDGNFCF